MRWKGTTTSYLLPHKKEVTVHPTLALGLAFTVVPSMHPATVLHVVECQSPCMFFAINDVVTPCF